MLRCVEVVQAREWVLAASLDPGISHAAGQRTCPACLQGTFEANLACHLCGACCDMCMVTGRFSAFQMLPTWSSIRNTRC